MGKQEVAGKRLSHGAVKKGSSSKLNSKSLLVRINSLAGDPSNGGSLSRKQSPSMIMTSRNAIRGHISRLKAGQNQANSSSHGDDTCLRLPPKPDDGDDDAGMDTFKDSMDMPPQIPRRCSSLLNHEVSRQTMSNHAFNGSSHGISGQKNAVFGTLDSSTNSTGSRFWDHTPSSLDKAPKSACPSYNRNISDTPPRMVSRRNESVSALNSLGGIRLQSTTQLSGLHMPSASERIHPPEVISGNTISSSSLSSSPKSVLSGVSFIEVSPGVRARLRDAQETWAWIQKDFYRPISCSGCLTELCTVKDADYVLCSACQVLSSTDSNSHDGGVGLGFTLDDLRKWESGECGSPI